jgi:hypothetical protein
MNAKLFVFTFLVILANSAKGEPLVTFRLISKVNGEKLVLNEKMYANANGDSFTVSMFKYYVSNISLLNDGKPVYTEPESYHLINEARTSSRQFGLSTIAPITFDAIRFMIGVDSIKNVSGAQSGALDPINAMFWDWNTGYIMAKMEGNSTNAPEGTVEFHIGGFSGSVATPRWVTLNLPGPVTPGDKEVTITIASDLGQWFKSPTTISFKEMPVVTTEGKDAVTIADNYADMFTIESVE